MIISHRVGLIITIISMAAELTEAALTGSSVKSQHHSSPQGWDGMRCLSDKHLIVCGDLQLQPHWCKVAEICVGDPVYLAFHQTIIVGIDTVNICTCPRLLAHVCAVYRLPLPALQAPASMKSVLQGGWLLTVAFGNVIVLIVAEGAGLEQVQHHHKLKEWRCRSKEAWVTVGQGSAPSPV